MTATLAQADVLFSQIRDLVAANPHLFGSLQPMARDRHGRGSIASKTHLRFTNGAEIRTRPFGASVRGIHPNMLLLDDVLTDTNTGSQEQRDRAWQYFQDTLLPMHARQVVIVGTTLHHDDLMHRLKPRTSGGVEGQTPPTVTRVHGFAWRRYPAIRDDLGGSLWPGRHPLDELLALQEEEPTIFSREYLNVPRDDASSLFPHDLTQLALDAGAGAGFEHDYWPEPWESVVIGADLAISESAGGDFSVAVVVVYDHRTGVRRVIAAERRKGLGYLEQADLLTDLCVRFHAHLGIVENNGFQAWIFEEFRKRPETSVILPHTTGREKTRYPDGIPAIKLALMHGLWVMPNGDQASHRFAKTWQAELSAFGWKDGRLKGLGEHDDTVMATWFAELAIRQLLVLLAEAEADDIVTMADLGIEPVYIGPGF
jgi:hypothetical protein